jgi:hypothetical protein
MQQLEPVLHSYVVCTQSHTSSSSRPNPTNKSIMHDECMGMPPSILIPPCLRVSLQATQSIKKQRISAAGKPLADAETHDVHHTRKDVKKSNSTGCGSCYGAETAALPCCNLCEDVS